MGYTRKEFDQLLPLALKGYAYEYKDDQISITLGQGQLHLTLGNEQQRRIATIALPYLPVKFEAEQVTDAEMHTFLHQFDLYYRKGGG